MNYKSKLLGMVAAFSLTDKELDRIKENMRVVKESENYAKEIKKKKHWWKHTNSRDKYKLK